MRLRRGALAGAAAAALTVTGCGWTDPTPSVNIAPAPPQRPSRPGRTHLRAAGFGLPSSFNVRLVPAPAAAGLAGAVPRADSPHYPTAARTPEEEVEATRPPSAAAIPTREVLLGQLSPVAVVPPVAIRIPDHGVDSSIVPVGVEAGTGELSVPLDPSQVGWYHFGSTPGDAGSAVLAGHLDWKGQPGAFIDLDRVQPGERVEIDLGDGTNRAFVVVETHLIAKTELPPELFERRGPPKLVLITCGGEFDPSIRRYRQNVVVVASPA